MTNVIVLVAILFLTTGDKQEGLRDFNVSGIECRHIAKNVTPRMVGKDVDKYVDTCVQWDGRVARIADADPNVPGMKAWVVPIEGKFAYLGSTLLNIDLAPSGRVEEDPHYGSLGQCDFLYSLGYSDIRTGDLVSFTGRILGISKKPDPAHGGSSVTRALIGIIEIHKLQREAGSTN
jgi:hypothetical protein